jgi:hypothetical protein
MSSYRASFTICRAIWVSILRRVLNGIVIRFSPGSRRARLPAPYVILLSVIVKR